MKLEDRITQQFNDSIATKQAAVKVLVPHILAAGKLMAESLKHDGKVMSCGNGGSAADSQHFSAELLNRYERERPGIAGRCGRWAARATCCWPSRLPVTPPT